MESFSETIIRADVPSEEREPLITFCATIVGEDGAVLPRLRRQVVVFFISPQIFQFHVSAAHFWKGRLKGEAAETKEGVQQILSHILAVFKHSEMK